MPPSVSERETVPTTIAAIGGAITSSIVRARVQRQPICDHKVAEPAVPEAEAAGVPNRRELWCRGLAPLTLPQVIRAARHLQGPDDAMRSMSLPRPRRTADLPPYFVG